jgi:hypothetical protein
MLEWRKEGQIYPTIICNVIEIRFVLRCEFRAVWECNFKQNSVGRRGCVWSEQEEEMSVIASFLLHHFALFLYRASVRRLWRHRERAESKRPWRRASGPYLYWTIKWNGGLRVAQLHIHMQYAARIYKTYCVSFLISFNMLKLAT